MTDPTPETDTTLDDQMIADLRRLHAEWGALKRAGRLAYQLTPDEFEAFDRAVDQRDAYRAANSALIEERDAALISSRAVNHVLARLTESGATSTSQAVALMIDREIRRMSGEHVGPPVEAIPPSAQNEPWPFSGAPTL